MCSSLKHQNVVCKPAAKVDVINCHSGHKGQAEWSGFCRNENFQWWQKQGKAVKVLVSVHSFNEQGMDIRVPGGNLHGLGLKKDVMVNGRLVGRAKSVKILTRPPMNEFERQHHNRWPVIPVKSGGFYTFTSGDVISKG